MKHLKAKSVRRSTSSARGFSLTELLIVVLILGIIAAIGVTEARKAFNKTRLAGTANDLHIFFQSALTELHKPRGVGMEQTEIFVRINARSSDGSTTVDLLSDTDEDGLLGVPDTVIRTYTIPDDIVLALGVSPTPADCLYGGTGCTVTTAKANVATLNWSTDADDAAVSRALRLDFRGRTINVVTGTASTAMITDIARLAVSHRNMVQTTMGRLTPLTTYEISISPLWSVSAKRGIWDGTKFTYN
jgi:prepilin-type N-terminal cleavage/methylation domain-containing protein